MSAGKAMSVPKGRVLPHWN